MRRSLDCFLRRDDTDPQVPTAGKGARFGVLPAILSVAGASLLLAGCTGVNAALLPDTAVQATATACGCNCYLYESTKKSGVWR